MREFVQVANAFLIVRFARNILHLPFSFVLLIKFLRQDSFVLSNPAQLVAEKRYLQTFSPLQPPAYEVHRNGMKFRNYYLECRSQIRIK